MAQLKEAATLETEQSFNESELADIMSEIENLEKDFLADASISNSDSSSAEVSENPQMQEEEEIVAESPSPEEELLEKELSSKSTTVENPEVLKINKEEIRKTSLQEVIDQEVQASLFPPRNNSQDAKMHFTVEGKMRVNLSFVVGGQPIELVVSETEGLVINLAHGAKFTVPFSEVAVKGSKKVA